MDKAIIIGAGTYGQVYAEYIQEQGSYDVIGFLDDDQAKHNTLVFGKPVLGSTSLLSSLSEKDKTAVFVPIGNNEVRLRILKQAESLGFLTPSFVHYSVHIHKTVTIGKSVYILPSTSIMPHTQIEDYVMISMGVNIAHHSVIGKGSFLSQGVNVGASIDIGESAFLGISSTIMTGIKSIGNNAIVGAGAVVIKDVPENVVVAGVPAKIIRLLAKNE
jgi:sugar O-acyltransferase (sialic acid O-acetyltransferase NeuD family)